MIGDNSYHGSPWSTTLAAFLPRVAPLEYMKSACLVKYHHKIMQERGLPMPDADKALYHLINILQ